MKNISILLSIWLLIGASTSGAQVTGDIKTQASGSLLSELSLNIDKPEPVSGVSIKYSSLDDLRGLNLNLKPVLDLLSQLESKGAMIEARALESGGVTMLELKVDGKPIKPILVECNQCVIVFEY